MELGHSKAAVSGASGVSSPSGTSGTSGKAHGGHLLNGLEAINNALADLTAKVDNMRAALPEYEMTHKKKSVSGTSGTSGASGVSAGRKHALWN